MLDHIDLDKKLSKKEYRRQLPRWRHRLLQLQQAAWQAKVASLLVFEGWNGAGKSDCIRKLTERLEPRGFQLFYGAQESRSYERHLPWMWRFYLETPAYGQMTIFHHSWYHRALLGRGKGRLDDRDWARTVRDILDFERALTDDGYVAIKLFLHVSKEEREARYRAMEDDPALSWKVTKRDWKHHRRYDEYLELVEEILVRTETAAGPWTIVEATDPHWARIKVLETIVRRLEDALKIRDVPLPDPLDDSGEISEGS